MNLRVLSLFGFFVMLGIAYLLSSDRKRINYRTIYWGIGLQVLFFLLVVGIPALELSGPLNFIFIKMNDVVNAVIDFTNAGTTFLFGPLASREKVGGLVFAIEILPTIVFTSTLLAVFYHLGVMQIIVRALAWVMYRTMRISGAEALANSANIFVGQTEAPLVIKPYLLKMTRSELLCIMIAGMASTAGGVLVAYVKMLRGEIPDIAGHLLAASVLSAPASFCIAKLMVPETSKPETLGDLPKESEKIDSNVFEAATRGASEGMYLAFNVGAMLLAFVALIAFVNSFFGLFGLSLELIFGWAFSPIAMLMGIPWEDIGVAGKLLGEKTVFNEFVAYLHLASSSESISPRSMTILTYALCGFANFSSIGIQIGGIGLMAPGKKSEIAKLGLKAMIGGNLATFMTACLAGVFI
ncbi:MAG: nucleoside transporter C-terminal domain-containing protein [Pseudomonadota bacterium]|nr:nucleoside transporter C-terminal domain-containing protein [Pseudomonadota bacterium]